SPEPPDAFRPHLLIEVNNHLGVASSGQGVTAGKELAAQVTKVVDLAIEDHGHRPILVADGLVTSRQVDDGEPTMPKTHRTVGEHPRVVRATMKHDVPHRDNLGRVYRAAV